MVINKNRIGIFISTISIALFAILPLLNLIIMQVVGLGEGFLGTLYIVSVLLILFSVLVFNRRIVKAWMSFGVLLLTLLITFGLTFSASLPSTLKPTFFIICTLVPFISPQFVTVDSKIMIKLLTIIPSIGILSVSSFFADDGSIKMNVTYAFLIPIVSSLVYYFTYYHKDKGKTKLFMTIVLLINFVYFIMCLLFGSRAPSLSVLICFLFFICIEQSQYTKGFRLKKIGWLYLMLPLIIVWNFNSVLLLTENIFKYFGWESLSLERLIMLNEIGMLDSGRSDINKLAMKGIYSSPLYGHGMSTSEYFTGHSYPHNFILQLLLDGGVFLFLIILIPTITRILQIKKTCSYSEFSLLSTLFFASVPAAFFSLDLWENSSFWLFMGFLFSRRFHLYSNNIKL